MLLPDHLQPWEQGGRKAWALSSPLSLADAELLDAQLRGSEWRSSEGEGLVNEVDTELKWGRTGKEKVWSITRVDNFFRTNGWRVQRLRVTAGRVEEIEWQKGEDLLTWTRVG